ncbi:RidA family protein [Parasphingorhabdus litoris]|uniref:RidA family protein n=1 Tax=Parasphingorhabdus litoris TaxID=394733 RepID=A0ABN1A9T6_9SPHN|nr:RidA family protein [Parasphingorhabdus litoris]
MTKKRNHFSTVDHIVNNEVHMASQRKVITLESDPLAPYAIAPGWRVGDLLFLSGQAAIDEMGNIVGAEDFDQQVAQTFVNIDRVLAAGGSSRDKIVKVTIYLTDMANFPKIVEARKQYFSEPYPADTIVEVKALALPELMVEIDVIAAV